MDFIFYVIVALVAAWMGWHARGIILLYHLTRNPQAVINLLERLRDLDEDEEPADGLTHVEVSNVGTSWYVYQQSTGQFLGQGTSLEQAMAAAQLKLPKARLWHKDHDESSQTA